MWLNKNYHSNPKHPIKTKTFKINVSDYLRDAGEVLDMLKTHKIIRNM
jgi:hypothetical protein